ncbi:MAG: hypothetical protein EPO24_01950 [Bacteroidetes bacterium]|nr:MAG: hypothetical protein EPO24_01950 [Bacteroidota bacterium]
MKSLKGYFFILGAATFWGISATAAKFLFNNQADPLTLVQLRMTFSCLILLAYFLLFKRDALKIQIADLPRFALLGILGIAGSNFTYYFTIKETNVATAILLQYLAPLFVLSYAAIRKSEEMTAGKVIAGIVSLAGCFLAVGGESFSLAGISRVGLVVGFCAAGCWSFTNIYLPRLVKKYGIWTSMMYAFISASVFWLIINPPTVLIEANYSSEMWLTFFGFAIISILIPHTFYFSGVKYLTPTQAIITATSEPIIAISSAFLALGEALTPVQFTGALLVIAAIMILQMKKERGGTRCAAVD